MIVRIVTLRIVIEEETTDGTFGEVENDKPMADAITAHLMDTFNDDDSIKEIALVRADWTVEEILT